jgi:hypothetical protein
MDGRLMEPACRRSAMALSLSVWLARAAAERVVGVEQFAVLMRVLGDRRSDQEI